MVPLVSCSAIATRIIDALGNDTGEVTEPQKPAYQMVWPQDIDEMDPPLRHPDLVSNLTTILADLDDIRTNVSREGGELVLSSFFWLAYDGMKLNLPRQKFLYDYLNTALFPYRYRDIERVAAFQNRVFRKYASSRGVAFIDVAASLPREPDLYDDAIHAKYEGVKLHAWIVAQQLAPIILKRLKDNDLPRTSGQASGKHPAFPGNERTAVFACDGDRLDIKRAYPGIVAPPASALAVPAGPSHIR
jgi:hypothetical protein